MHLLYNSYCFLSMFTLYVQDLQIALLEVVSDYRRHILSAY
jgi:hypothetical protein